MSQVTQSIGRLIDELGKLPGVGRKSAERLAYHLLRVNKAEAIGLADAIRDVRERPDAERRADQPGCLDAGARGPIARRP